MTTLYIYTDGSCKGNPGPGGWAFVLVQPDAIYEDLAMSGALTNTTNNRAELMAVIEAIETLERLGYRVDTIQVYSDSQYVVNIAAGKWKRKTNFDLWQRFELAKRNCLQKVTRELQFQWIRGHDGNLWNEKVNALAQQQCL
jgi:ribonuclease HI